MNRDPLSRVTTGLTRALNDIIDKGDLAGGGGVINRIAGRPFLESRCATKMRHGMLSSGRHPNRTAGAGADAKPAAIPQRTTGLALAAVAATVFVALSGALSNGLVWDDQPNLVNNQAYRGLSWSNLGWMFTTSHGGHYQPLSWLSFAVDHELWGSTDAFGFHLTNLVLHALTAAGVYLVARRLLRMTCGSAGGAAVVVGALAAALSFGVHPLRVESVAWATERRDVLSGVFLVLTVLCYLRAKEPGARSHRVRFLTLALMCYVLSLLAKATGMTLPVVLLILDVYPLRRFEAGNIGEPKWLVLREKLLFLAPALVIAGLALRAQTHAGALWSAADHPISLRIAQAFYGLLFYPLKTLFPVNLVPLYEHRPDAAVLSAANVIGVVLVASVTATAWAWRRRAPACLAAWGSYVVLVSPMLGLAQSGPQVVADRYSYIACLPFALLIGGGLSLLWARLGRTHRGLRSVVAIGLAGVCLLLISLTRAQVRMWRDPYTLWTTTLARAPETPTAHANLAVVHYNRGEAEQARRHALATLEQLPGNRSAHVTLAHASLDLGDPQTAERSFRIALEIATTLGRTDVASSAGLAESLMQQHRFTEAEAVYRSLIQTHPKVAAWHVNLAGALVEQDRTDKAMASLEQAATVDPGFVSAYLRLATLHTRAGEPGEAVAALERGLAALPDDVNLLAQLAWLLATSSVDALRDGSRAVELATRAHTHSGGMSIRATEALAAAQAETGSYQAAERLIADLLADPPTPLSEKVRERLDAAAETYGEKRPMRE